MAHLRKPVGQTAHGQNGLLSGRSPAQPRIQYTPHHQSVLRLFRETKDIHSAIRSCQKESRRRRLGIGNSAQIHVDIPFFCNSNEEERKAKSVERFGSSRHDGSSISVGDGRGSRLRMMLITGNHANESSARVDWFYTYHRGSNPGRI